MRKKHDSMQLAEYVLEYIIYLDSGYDAFRALKMLAGKNDGKALTKIFRGAVNRIMTGVSAHKALSAAVDESDDPNLDTFLRIVSRCYSKGEEGAVIELRILMERIFHESLSQTRENAEKANTRLSFPITLIFIAIVLISVYPALAQFKI